MSPVAEELRWGFKRAGGRRLLSYLFFVPFLGAGILLASMALLEGRALAALHVHERPMLTAPSAGPIRLEGVAHRDSLVTSPTGQRAIGWVGHAGYQERDSDGDVRFVAVCSRGSFFDVTVKDGPFERRVALARPGDGLAFSSGVEAEAPILAVETMKTYAGIPAEMTEQCLGSLGVPAGHTLEYREGLIAEGEHVELLACASPDGVSPCHRGHDLLTTGRIDARLDHLRRGAALLGAFASFWNGIIGLVVALTLLDTIPTGRRK